MQNAKLPARPSLEYLRKIAKERLAAMRRTNPRAQLATALLAVAQEHGFSSWRALKAEIDRRHSTDAQRLFSACKMGDVTAVRALLAADPMLVHVRDAGHNAHALYFAATAGHVDVVRVLLDAGAEPDTRDDVNELGVIGWVTYFRPPDDIPMDVVSLLLERGARHHIFSAIAIGDLELIRTLVERNHDVLDRRMSRLQHGRTALHFAITRRRDDILDLLLKILGGMAGGFVVRRHRQSTIEPVQTGSRRY